jgi:hypothetical protein
VDGARITVLVIGLKDITWYKNMIWGKIQGVWEKLPEFLKGKLLSFLFKKLQERYEQIPDVVNGVTITTWNYTDLDGRCTVELGKNCEYLFLIQQGNLKKPWQLARHNMLRVLRTHTDKTFHIILPDVSQRIQRHTQAEMPEGDCRFHVSFTTTAYQPQQNFFTDGVGIYEPAGSIDCFFVDQQNFDKYKAGKPFTCYNYLENEQTNISFSAVQQDWYLIFRNHAQLTSVILNLSVDVAAATPLDQVQIVTPDTTLFETPVCTVGDTVVFSGIATDTVFLSFDHQPYAIEIPCVDNEWSYVWNTSENQPGAHIITVFCGNASDERTITLLDTFPPLVTIVEPTNGAIVEAGSLFISGSSTDNVGVEHVEVAVDNEWREANGTHPWTITWDISELPLSDHTLSARAVDAQGRQSTTTISFVVNETGHPWGPQILQLYDCPEHPTNTSNMIIYANVTTTSPFAIQTIVLFCNNGSGISSYEMYHYGDYPVQSRHEEDPLQNQSNSPLYGVELGQFPTGTTITYWVIASDTAHNTKQSDINSFTIE